MEQNTTTAPVVNIEPTSAKLTELKTQAAKIAGDLKGAEFGTPDFQNHLDALLQNKKDIAGEVANIRAEQAAEKLAVLRQERVKFVDDFATAVLADAKKSTDDTKATLQAAKDALINLVLPNHAAKTASAPKEGGGTKGGVSAAIKAEFDSRINAGMSPSDAMKEILALKNADGNATYARGTVGTVRTAFWPVVK